MHTQYLVLKPGKEKPIKHRHHWIFSGAIAKLPEKCKGKIFGVQSHNGEFLGHAYVHPDVSITARMINFDDNDPLDAIRSNLINAIKMRTSYFDEKQTNAYRVINGEGDALPGLVVDKYNSTLVIQFLTLGMENLRPLVIDTLRDLLSPTTIYEKSVHGSRKEEGLEAREGLIHGDDIDEIEVLENGLKFIVSVKFGQKTGFFLDQREMRDQVKALSLGKKVLNCFAYTGGFSIYAMAGGATSVDSVDTSDKALSFVSRNINANSLDHTKHRNIQSDVFQFLKNQDLDYEVVILDPPAFAKGKKDIFDACRGYKEINRLAIKKMPQGSILLTCSCSGHIDNILFQQVIFQAASDAKRVVKIIGRHRLAADHPINIFHPETEYLKSLLLYIE